MAGENGQKNRNKRAGVEGAISQAVRGFGMRQTRYRSLAKTKLQHLATAAAINIDRFIAYKLGGPKSPNEDLSFCAVDGHNLTLPTIIHVDEIYTTMHVKVQLQWTLRLNF